MKAKEDPVLHQFFRRNKTLIDKARCGNEYVKSYYLTYKAKGLTDREAMKQIRQILLRRTEQWNLRI